MPDQDKSDAVVASAKARGKRPSGALPKLNLCGDIGLKIGRDGTWYYQGGAIGAERARQAVRLGAPARGGRALLPGHAGREGADRRRDDALHRRGDEHGRGGEEAKPLLPHQCGRHGDGRAEAPARLSSAGRPGASSPFILVRDGLKARLSRPVYYELAALAAESRSRQGQGCGAKARSSRSRPRRARLGPLATRFAGRAPLWCCCAVPPRVPSQLDVSHRADRYSSLRVALSDLRGLSVCGERRAAGPTCGRARRSSGCSRRASGFSLSSWRRSSRFSGGKPGGTYHPPSLEDGVIKPGEID